MLNIKKVVIAVLCLHLSLSADRPVTINGKQFVQTISPQQLDARIRELGAQITQDYAGKAPVIIGVLNGAFIFMADLIRAIDGDCDIDFIKISSYGNGMKSSGTIQLQKDLTTSITGRNVIVVEDVVDSGRSITFLRNLLMEQNPASIRIASLLFKPDTAKIDFPIDYVGFSIAPDFVIGYGIDYAQRGRNLPALYTLAQ